MPFFRFPAHFEYGKFHYIDSGRVEPRIAYTPTNTPPKTPQIPRYDNKPFKQPNYVDGTWEFPLIRRLLLLNQAQLFDLQI